MVINKFKVRKLCSLIKLEWTHLLTVSLQISPVEYEHPGAADAVYYSCRVAFPANVLPLCLNHWVICVMYVKELVIMQFLM